MSRGREKGLTLMLGAMALVFIVPMIGLAIDVGFLYGVKSKLQSAVDGAALAAARSLSTGETTSAQTTTAQTNAVNWFYANFPSTYFGTSGTAMNSNNVTVADDPNNAHLRDVTVTASTNVGTFFMKWFNSGSIAINATGTASRRDIVAMLVLDRSFSIQLASACSTMIAAAKTFTGQFAEGRDNIGLVTFANDVWTEHAPTTSFQTLLGYTNDQGSGTGLIDQINCQGNTNTSSAISVAYNQLWTMNEPGALNAIVLETDGLPNTMTLNFWDSTNSLVGLTSSSTCKDSQATPGLLYKDTASSKFSTITWTPSIPLGTTSYLSGNPTSTPGAGNLVGAVGVPDPGDATCCEAPLDFIYMQRPYNGSMMPVAPGNTIADFESTWATNTSTSASGCGFYGSSTASSPDASGNGTNMAMPASDIAWFPLTDVFGNSLNPATNPYQSVCKTSDSKHILNGTCSNGNNAYTNYHNAAENAADNAAYNARNGYDLLSPNTGTAMQAMIFVIGLGGTVGSPPDPILMQRIANDPNGDSFNVPPKYSACTSETGCVTYSTQPQGMFIYSSTPSTWSEAFTLLSSQILRLAK